MLKSSPLHPLNASVSELDTSRAMQDEPEKQGLLESAKNGMANVSGKRHITTKARQTDPPTMFQTLAERKNGALFFRVSIMIVRGRLRRLVMTS